MSGVLFAPCVGRIVLVMSEGNFISYITPNSMFFPFVHKQYHSQGLMQVHLFSQIRVGKNIFAYIFI